MLTIHLDNLPSACLGSAALDTACSTRCFASSSLAFVQVPTLINIAFSTHQCFSAIDSLASLHLQGALSVPHLLVSHVFEEVLHMAAPSEGGRSFCEGMQDELADILMRTVNIISNFFEMLDLDKNGNVELADLHRMQVCLHFTTYHKCFACYAEAFERVQAPGTCRKCTKGWHHLLVSGKSSLCTVIFAVRQVCMTTFAACNSFGLNISKHSGGREAYTDLEQLHLQDSKLSGCICYARSLHDRKAA